RAAFAHVIAGCYAPTPRPVCQTSPTSPLLPQCPKRRRPVHPRLVEREPTICAAAPADPVSAWTRLPSSAGPPWCPRRPGLRDRFGCDRRIALMDAEQSLFHLAQFIARLRGLLELQIARVVQHLFLEAPDLSGESGLVHRLVSGLTLR